MFDVLDKAETGPICTERDFDLKILVPKIKELTKAYEIKYDPETPLTGASLIAAYSPEFGVGPVLPIALSRSITSF